jgi:hypothetical protein
MHKRSPRLLMPSSTDAAAAGVMWHQAEIRIVPAVAIDGTSAQVSQGGTNCENRHFDDLQAGR